MTPPPKLSRNRTNLFLDIAIFVAFLLAGAPHGTGIPVHEWLSIALIGALIVHLLLHWTWIVNTTRRFFGNVGTRNRINYVLNMALFIDVVLIMFTGMMISEAVLPTLSISVPSGFAWRRLHDITANLGVLILALHIAIHWRWITSMTSKYILRRLITPTAAEVPVQDVAPGEARS
jgi:hypothetical protein